MAEILNKTTHSAEETEKLASEFAKTLPRGALVLLIGDLGSGKTTFVKGLARGLEVPSAVNIHSPTFTLINEYPGKTPLFHVDLYRLDDSRQIDELALEDYLNRDGILAVEWADRDLHRWPKGAFIVRFEMGEKDRRSIAIEKR
ncbi:MAG: tRNA (adenosine(37)-N6)-threonylcarbamoyltransferase complex ATPase subunit type 1 TsaE [bacterium]